MRSPKRSRIRLTGRTKRSVFSLMLALVLVFNIVLPAGIASAYSNAGDSGGGAAASLSSPVSGLPPGETDDPVDSDSDDTDYICDLPEHSHSLEDGCYEDGVLVCEFPEHTHSEECWERVFVVCGIQGHKHTAECFADGIIRSGEDADGYAVCGHKEHIHTIWCIPEDERPELPQIESSGQDDGNGSGDGLGEGIGDSGYTVDPSIPDSVPDSEVDSDTPYRSTDPAEDETGNDDADIDASDPGSSDESDNGSGADSDTGPDASSDPGIHSTPETTPPPTEPDTDTGLDTDSDTGEGSEQAWSCGKQEHVHTETCFAGDGTLICGMEEHLHTESCLAPQDTQTSDTPDSSQDTSSDDPSEVPAEGDTLPDDTTDDTDDSEGKDGPEGEDTDLNSPDGDGDDSDVPDGDIQGDPSDDTADDSQGDEEPPYEPGTDAPDVGDPAEDGPDTDDPFPPRNDGSQNDSGNGDPSTPPNPTFGDLVSELEDYWICGKQEHTHTASCWNDEGTELICLLEEHTHTLFCLPQEMWGLFLTSLTSLNDESSFDLSDFIIGVSISDEKGEGIDEDGRLYVGRKYNIHLDFKELNAQSTQMAWDENDNMYFQFPPEFDVDEVKDYPISVKIGGTAVVIGEITVDENGKLTLHLSEQGKAAILASTDIDISFDINATAQAPQGDGDVHFGGAGTDFKFTVSDDPVYDVRKTATYDQTTETIKYKVRATVEYGTIHDVVLTDKIDPPSSSSVSVELVKDAAGKPGVTVTYKKADGSTGVIPPEDYDLELVEDPLNPNAPQTFKVKLHEGSAYCPMDVGDEIDVEYEYKVKFNDTSIGGYFANVKNTAEVDSQMYTYPDPADPSTVQKNPLHEQWETDVTVQKVNPGIGVISKDQTYDEATGKMHYTIYAAVKPGTFERLNINDSMVVNYQDADWVIKGLERNAVRDIKAKAADIDDWQYTAENAVPAGPSDPNAWVELKGLTPEEAREALQNGDTETYDPNDMDYYVLVHNDNSFILNFGWTDEHWAGRWNHDSARLIVVDFDLYIRGGVTLKNTSTGETVTLSGDEILGLGITNTAGIEYSGWASTYTCFYNNHKTLVKTGRLDKKTNTIEYSVVLSTTNPLVRDYLAKIPPDWHSPWVWEDSMQVVFHDEPEPGWKYVEGSLTETLTFTDWHGVLEYPYWDGAPIQVTTMDPDEINAPIIWFKDAADKGDSYPLLNTSSLAEIEFKYKVKATPEWLAEHADEELVIHNKATIRDKQSGVDFDHWTAETDILYPARMSKYGEQQGNSGLIKFTLYVNPAGVDLIPGNPYLIVNDESINMQIQQDSIEVVDDKGDPVQFKFLTAKTGQYRLQVPDEVPLTITYNALVMETGDDVVVSNQASIEGVESATGGYENVLKVDGISTGGGGNVWQLNIKKVDENTSEGLSGAKFHFYIVRDADSALPHVQDIGDYSVYTENTWEVIPDAKGNFQIGKEMDWKLEPGNYYILVEEEAPAGYKKLDDPIIFYFGYENDEKRDVYPDAELALPDGTVVIGNKRDENSPAGTLPNTGGSGLAMLYPLLGICILSICASTVLMSRMYVWAFRNPDDGQVSTEERKNRPRFRK